jgi:hypothetical protein
LILTIPPPGQNANNPPMTLDNPKSKLDAAFSGKPRVGNILALPVNEDGSRVRN